MLKQGSGGKFFNSKENERYEGAMHQLQEWATDEQKLEFLKKYGWLMKDEAVKAYSKQAESSKKFYRELTDTVGTDLRF